MSPLITILIILGSIIIIIAIYFIFFKKNNIKSILEIGGSSGGAFSLFVRKDRRIYLDSLETIINSSEKLSSIINNSTKKEEIYAKLLQDEKLVERLRNAKNIKEIEKILIKWLKDNKYISRAEFEKYWKDITGSGYYDEVNNEENKSNNKPKRKYKKRSPRVKKEKIHIERFDKPKQKRKYVKRISNPSHQKIHNANINEKPGEPPNNPNQIPNKNEKIDPGYSLKSVEFYEQIVYLLETGKIDEILDILKKLNYTQLKEILKYYNSNQSDNNDKKFNKLLRKSKKPTDITQLLHLEAVKSLEDELSRIKEIFSRARRKGLVVKSEELDLLSIPSKIKMFKATFDKKDFYKVRNALLEIEKNILVKMSEKGIKPF